MSVNWLISLQKSSFTVRSRNIYPEIGALCSVLTEQCGIADSGSDGTWKRTVGEVKGKDANGEGTQHSSACASSVTTNNKNMRHFQHHCFRITLN